MRRSIVTHLFVVCIMLSLFCLSANASEESIVGLWLDAGQRPVYDFLEGFKPNRGIVLEFEDGQVDELAQWNIEGEKITIGYMTYSVKIEENILYIDEQPYTRSQEELPQEILVSLKENPAAFVEQLTQATWIDPIETNTTHSFIRGFSPDTGVYSAFVEDAVEKLSSWSVANDVFKIGSTVYPNAKILPHHLLLLDSRDRIQLLNRGDAVEALSQTDLSEERDEFLDLLTRGTWHNRRYLYEFRPTFGDLSGSIFIYGTTKNQYRYSEDWEYSLETGILKWEHKEYVGGRVLGDYLLLQEDDSETALFIRWEDSSSEQEPHSKSKKISVSERDMGDLHKMLSRQWFRRPYFYIFDFDPTKPQGFLHEFRSIPFVIAGNTITIEDKPEFEELWQWEDKVVFGHNAFSLQADASPVYMLPIDEEQALAIADEQAAALEGMQSQHMELIIELTDGSTVEIPVPAGNFSEIQSIRLQPK